MTLYHIYQARKGKTYMIKAGNFLSRRENSNQGRDLSIKELRTSVSILYLGMKGPFQLERGLPINEGTSLSGKGPSSSRKGPFHQGGGLSSHRRTFLLRKKLFCQGRDICFWQGIELLIKKKTFLILRQIPHANHLMINISVISF